MAEGIIWQPGGLYQQGSDFNVRLDSKFAKKILVVDVGAERQRQIIRHARDMIKDRNVSYPEVFDFYKNTAFVCAFHIGNNGKWLSLERGGGRMPDGGEKYIYHSHNVDSAFDAYTLMTLVDVWATYADIYIERPK